MSAVSKTRKIPPPIAEVAKGLKGKTGDDKLIDNLIDSYSAIGSAYLAGKPVPLLQNLGLFIESSLRVIEHIVFTTHTPLSKRFDLDRIIENLEKASGPAGLRILAARIARAVFDFRSRKKSVHLRDVDPLLIDGFFAYNACTWIFIEILKESGLSDAEAFIILLATRKSPLVQEVGGILRTTDPNLSGTKRLLLLLYSAQTPISEDDLLEGTRTKIRTKNHLRKNLRNMELRDLVHCLGGGQWCLFGRGILEAETIILASS